MKKLVLTFLILIASSQSHGSVLLEPYVGIPYGTWKNQRTVPNVYDMQVRGFTAGVGYGARLAYTTNYFFAGLDYTNWLVQWKFNKIGNSGVDDGWRDVNGTQTTLGPILGFVNTTKSFYLWATYYLQSDLKLDADIDPSMPKPTYKGTGYGLSMGFRFLTNFKLNFEYQIHNFDKWIYDGNEITLEGTSLGLTQKPIRYEVYVATLGFPISFW